MHHSIVRKFTLELVKNFNDDVSVSFCGLWCSFENAAYVVFIVLMTRVILSYRLNLLIPISKASEDKQQFLLLCNNITLIALAADVPLPLMMCLIVCLSLYVSLGRQVDENMHEAQKRDATKRSKFWFRNDIITQMCENVVKSVGGPIANGVVDDEENMNDESCTLMTVDEVINGRGEQFPGLIQLIKQYLLSVEIDAATHCTINQYLNLISARASGKLLTAASFIRDFVKAHHDYQHDSIVSEIVNYDLIKTLNDISNGKVVIAQLTGEKKIA